MSDGASHAYRGRRTALEIAEQRFGHLSTDDVEALLDRHTEQRDQIEGVIRCLEDEAVAHADAADDLLTLLLARNNL